jgi:hypothetical protein
MEIHKPMNVVNKRRRFPSEWETLNTDLTNIVTKYGFRIEFDGYNEMFWWNIKCPWLKLFEFNVGLIFAPNSYGGHAHWYNEKRDDIALKMFQEIEDTISKYRPLKLEFRYE